MKHRFTFRQEALNERSQVHQKIAINEQSLRGARAASGAWNCAHRSTASSTTSR